MDRVRFEVLPDPFVGIELWGAGRQCEQLQRAVGVFNGRLVDVVDDLLRPRPPAALTIWLRATGGRGGTAA